METITNLLDGRTDALQILLASASRLDSAPPQHDPGLAHQISAHSGAYLAHLARVVPPRAGIPHVTVGHGATRLRLRRLNLLGGLPLCVHGSDVKCYRAMKRYR